MLYNKDWDKHHKVKADPHKLDTLIAWLRTKDPEEDYPYRSCSLCMLAQYYTAHGMWCVTLSKNMVMHIEDKSPHARVQMLPALFNWIAEATPHDFGHALERAELVRDEPSKAAREAFKLAYNW